MTANPKSSWVFLVLYLIFPGLLFASLGVLQTPKVSSHYSFNLGDTEKFTNWQTTAAGVVKLARGPNGEVVTLEHDACGRVVQRTVARNGFRPQTWTFGWNAQDQMVSAACPDGDVWTYAYDPFGRRVSKHCKHTKVTFIWDGDVIAREITETRGDVQTVDWFFEPGSFRPMARLERGDLSYIINDHLGTPKEVVGWEGGLRWSADHDTWGTLRTRAGKASAQVETGDYWVEPTSIAGNTERAYTPEPDHFYCPIRFQGQWEDAETGLYYNRFRCLDPFLGQFSSRDPIGIHGGVNAVIYVFSPSTSVDPWGLRDYPVTFNTATTDIATRGGVHVNVNDTGIFGNRPIHVLLRPDNQGGIALIPGQTHIGVNSPEWRRVQSSVNNWLDDPRNAERVASVADEMRTIDPRNAAQYNFLARNARNRCCGT